jgi:hypothetical protein
MVDKTFGQLHLRPPFKKEGSFGARSRRPGARPLPHTSPPSMNVAGFTGSYISQLEEAGLMSLACTILGHSAKDLPRDPHFGAQGVPPTRIRPSGSRAYFQASVYPLFLSMCDPSSLGPADFPHCCSRAESPRASNSTMLGAASRVAWLAAVGQDLASDSGRYLSEVFCDNVSWSHSPL